MNEKSYVNNIPQNKLDILIQQIPYPYEKIIIAGPIEFKTSGSFLSGFYMLTNGSIYIFKNKIIGNIEFVKSFHLYDLTSIFIDESILTLNFTNFQLQIKSAENEVFLNQIWGIFKSIVLKIPKFYSLFFNDPNISSLLSENNQLRQYSLVDRIIFFSHYYGISNEKLTCIEYFTKMEETNSNNKFWIILGPHCNIIHSSKPVAHAIDWQINIKTIFFQQTIKVCWKDFFSILHQNATSINRIVFTDYSNLSFNEFQICDIPELTPIKSYWFIHDSPQFLLHFFNQSTTFDIPISELFIGENFMAPQEFGEIVSLITQSKCSNQLKRVILFSISMSPFPFDDISILCSNFQNLKQLSLHSLKVDGSYLLRAIGSSTTSITQLFINNINFKANIMEIDANLPPNLLFLDISNCIFSRESLASFLRFCTCKFHLRPFELVAHSLSIDITAYLAFDDIFTGEVMTIEPNLSEFDWSQNYIPEKALRYFCAFLCTQRRLRNLIFNNVKIDESKAFLSYLFELIRNLRLPGIEICGKFSVPEFIHFIASLQSLQFIRHLVIKNFKAGDIGLETLSKTLTSLSLLNEIDADGFHPQNIQTLVNFWSLVARHPTISACNLPNQDFSNLGFTFQDSIKKNNVERAEFLDGLTSMHGLSTSYQRALMDEILYEKNNFNQEELNDDIFRETSDRMWDESLSEVDIGKILQVTNC